MNAALAALLVTAFGSPAHPLAAWYAGLLAESPPLQGFTATNAAKIRKKVRHATTAQTQRDLRCELAVAAVLADRRSPLTYEPLAAQGRRGPDFLLRHKGHTDVYVEVSRLRPARGQAHDPASRLAAVLCGKLGQLAPGAANLLIVVSDADPYTAETIGATLRGLRRRAAAQDDAYFAFRGLAGARALHQSLPHLGGMLVVMAAAPAAAWFLHSQTRHALPADLVRAAQGWNIPTMIGPLPDDTPAEG